MQLLNGFAGMQWQSEPARQPQPLEKFAPILNELDRADGSKTVAVVTMAGSCCPVTNAHCLAFIRARELLLCEDGRKRVAKEHFAEVLGLLSLNGDKHVGEKLWMQGEPAISYQDRSKLVDLATADKPWLGFNRLRDHEAVEHLQKTWPKLLFIRYEMNGADDVCKYQKWKHCGENRRCIVMGRPGFTEQVKHGAESHGTPLDKGYFIMGPDLPDISSTAVRKALQWEHGQPSKPEDLTHLLHPKVAEWLLNSKIYAKQTRSDCSFCSFLSASFGWRSHS